MDGALCSFNVKFFMGLAAKLETSSNTLVRWLPLQISNSDSDTSANSCVLVTACDVVTLHILVPLIAVSPL